MQKLNSMQKIPGNVFLGHVGEWVFHIFPMLHSIMGGAPKYHLEFFVDVTIFSSSTM